VLLGKIVAKPCNLLLLDEPTHHLDIESIEALIDALEDFGGSVVIVTHSELILKRLALNKIVLCEEAKQTVFLGNYDEFLEKIGWDEKKKAAPKTAQQSVRKERAEQVAKRAAVIKPIEKQIHTIEQQIVALEEEQKQSIETAQQIKAQGIRKKQIEQLEAELYELYELLEQKKKEFEF